MQNRVRLSRTKIHRTKHWDAPPFSRVLRKGGVPRHGIAAAASGDPLGSTAKSLVPGTIVTVNGDLAQNQDVGNAELWYVTSINRTGMFPSPPDYTTAQADSTPADDCPAAPPNIQ